MIDFEKYTLNNGLKVILHSDHTTPMASLNITYRVGSKNEDPERTGLAHLFEHLMFGGSKHIPVYDKSLQVVGGENNAFTNADITHYYLTLPAENLETALWLESDRMLSPSLNQASLDTQRQVVIEEFKQSYLNQPYGDLMLLLKPLAYKVHPYRWNTIGKNIEHIAGTGLSDVEVFHRDYYCPNNAILSLAGNIDLLKTKESIEKWFGGIAGSVIPSHRLPQEPVQTEARFLEVERTVPFPALTKAYHMPGRTDGSFYCTDILSDILSNGNSSRLQSRLVNQKHIFASISAYLTGTNDNGLFIFTGILAPGISLRQADEALQEEVEQLKHIQVEERELQKVKNKIQTLLAYAELQVEDKGMNLGIFESMDKAERINDESILYKQPTSASIQQTAQTLFRPENCSTLYYKASV